MSRPLAGVLNDKNRSVQEAVAVARGADRRHFDFSREVAPGVRLILTEVDGAPLAFSLWSYQQDIAALCGDAAVPATAALLAIDGAQARAATRAGHTVDLTQMQRSQASPDTYYVLLDHASRAQVHTVLHTLVPSLEPHATAA